MGHCWVERERRINSDFRGEHKLYTYIVLFNFISTCHHMGTLTKYVGVLDSQNSFGCFEVKQWCVMCIGLFIKPTHTSLCLTKLKQ